MKDPLISLLADVLQVNISDINDDTTMNDLEIWDSLKHMELIAALEQAYEIEFDFDEIVSMKSILQIRQMLIQKGVINNGS